MSARNWWNAFALLSTLINFSVSSHLKSVYGRACDNRSEWTVYKPAQTLRWWSSAPRVAGTTSCTWCETSSFAFWEPSRPDTAPSSLPCSKTQRTKFPLRDVERNQLCPNVEVESAWRAVKVSKRKREEVRKLNLLVENVAESQLAVAASRVGVARNRLVMVDGNRQLPSFGTGKKLKINKKIRFAHLRWLDFL